MDIYKVMLNTIVKPITAHDEDRLQAWVARLKQSGGEGYAIGEMLERALRYVTITVALATEQNYPEELHKSERRWSDVVKALSTLYKSCSAGNDVASEVEALMQAYDEWLD